MSIWSFRIHPNKPEDGSESQHPDEFPSAIVLKAK